MIKAVFITLVLLVSAAIPNVAYADEPAIYTSWRNNLGVQGYDIVSFYSGSPQVGKAEFTTKHLGAEWQFRTRANMDLFKTNPEAFLPQYGGYCAWAAAKGKLAKGSAKHWHVEDGKLYLNFNNRIKKRWDKSRNDFIRKADERWPEILED